MSETDTVVDLGDVCSIGTPSTLCRGGFDRTSFRSQITSSSFDITKYDRISLGSENVFDDSGDAVMGYRDLMKQLREMEKENFSLKTRVYFLEDALAQYMEYDGEVSRDELKYELQQNEQLLQTANDTITELRRIMENEQNSYQAADDCDSIDSFELHELNAQNDNDEEDQLAVEHSVGYVKHDCTVQPGSTILIGPIEEQASFFKLSTLIMLGITAIGLGIHK